MDIISDTIFQQMLLKIILRMQIVWRHDKILEPKGKW